MSDNWRERDLKHIWHPCSQMKDYETFPLLEVVSAEGSWITLKSGERVLDAISSWWCKSLGHGHPAIAKAVRAQMEAFEHVILANTSHETIVELSEQLCGLAPHLQKVFYGGDGSTAVEIALKMSVHAHQLSGQSQRCEIMALQNGYHGETALTLGMSDLGLYKAPYVGMAQQAEMLGPLPYRSGLEDPSWNDAEKEWQACLPQLEAKAASLAAIIFEPVVQGAGGMQIYSPDFLKRLRLWTRERGIHLIADEIMTGFGRTGKPLACQHGDIEVDFICLSKGLTSGWMPLSAVLCPNSIYDLFYDDYESGKAFMHSNTYCGNALAAAAALATLKVYDDEGWMHGAHGLQDKMMNRWKDLAEKTGRLKNLRGIGGVVAAELRLEPEEEQQRMGYRIYQEAIKRGALLRPLGNTLYWFPPLNVKDSELDHLEQVSFEAIAAVLS